MDNKPKVLDWFEEENRIDLPPEPERKAYDDKIVAWIDILGMRNVIKDPKNDAEYVFGIMEKLRSYVQTLCDKLVADGKMDYLQIADGFIISADMDSADDMLRILATIQWRVLVENNMLLRGAVSAGKVSSSDTLQIIIGPAYIQAFELEYENAIFPRIILSEELIAVTKESLTFKYVAEDIDKQKYLDFLSYIFDVQKLTTSDMNHILTTNGVVKFLQTNYRNFMQRKTINLAQKYGWMIQQFKANKIKIL